jgi:hypothetical protein
VRVDGEDAADEEATEVAVDVRHTDVEHAFHLERGDRQPMGDLGRRRVDGHVLAKPRERSAH